ncbi:hypothetical protein HGO97_015390 [Faecalicatena sp. AGMB00832]|uniref:Uncharacterized protein n=1 Tax=Faecalicatena faecalis TaxID=2726362 RepID=A0ABS6D6F5_9FIRM|nr:hypothetical protein [Faecalicatena faecalis]MBU3877189.1 hypothetical protein [Faecalicatena faecalis]
MKKGMLTAGIIVVVLLLIWAYVVYPIAQKNKTFEEAPMDMSVEAKVDEYHSLEAIENSIGIIVKAEKVSEEEPVIWRDGQGNVYFVGMIGNVKISNIYKDESNQDIKIGSTISIFENEAYDAEKNVIYHVAGYKKMGIGKEYMLFLDYSEDDNWYVPCSAIWGKYPLDSTEAILYNSNERPAETSSANILVTQIGREVIEKYE